MIEKQVSFHDDPDGLVIKHTQEIPDFYLKELAEERFNSVHTPAGEFMRVASIPEAVVDKWRKEGFDIMREPVRDILKRLQKEELDAFLTTKKRV